MDLQSLLKPLEESLGDLYEWFSRLFEEDEEAASLFYRSLLDFADRRGKPFAAGEDRS